MIVQLNVSRKKSVPFLPGEHIKMYIPGTTANLCGKERYRQGIIQEFNLGVGSHVSITLNFAAEGEGEGMGKAVTPQ